MKSLRFLALLAVLTSFATASHAQSINGVPNQEVTATVTVTGTNNTPVILSNAGVPVAPEPFFYADQYTGATISEQINACIAAALTAAGTCDARAFGGTQFPDSQITVGNSAGQPVTLLLPVQGLWESTITNGTSCMLAQYSGTSIIGASPESGTAGSLILRPNTTSTSVSSLYCTLATASNPYFYAEGFAIQNTVVATTSGIGFLVNTQADDSSVWEHIVVLDSKDTYAAEFGGTCCSATARNMQFNGNYGAGVTPLLVANTAAFNVVDSSIVHEGSGEPALLVEDTANHVSVANFSNIYTETSNSDTSTCLYQLQGMGAVNFSHVSIKSNVSSNAATGICSNATTNTMVTIDGITFYNGSGDFFYPVTAVNNSFTGQIVTTDSTGQKGNLAFYSSNATAFNNIGGSTLSVVQPAAGSNTNASAVVTITGGTGGAASGATGAGKNGGSMTIAAGAGSAGGATSGTGGAGGTMTFSAGNGGAATAGSTTGNGGGITFNLGAAGATGTPGNPGIFNIVGAPILAGAEPLVKLTQTWTSAANVDAAFLEQVVNTSCTGTCYLMDLSSGSAGNTKEFTIDSAGNGIFNGGTTSTNVTDSALTSGDCVQATTGGQLVSASGACGTGGGGSTSWSALTAPTAALAITMPAGDTTAFTYATQASPSTTDFAFIGGADTGTSTTPIFSFTDTASNARTGALLSINTASSSTALPFQATAQGTANGISMSSAGALTAIGTGAISATQINGTALSGISTGVLCNTTTTGVPSNCSSVSAGTAGSNTNGTNMLVLTAQAGGAASPTTTGTGKTGGGYGFTGGAGSAGGSTSGNGGAGGGFSVTTGAGGSAASGSTNGNGGAIAFTLGSPGAGAGTAGTPQNFSITRSVVGGATTSALLKITDTWNTTGVAAGEIFVNVTNTASGAGSLLENLEIGSATQWSVDKTGTITFAGGFDQTAASNTGGTCAMAAATSCTITIAHTYTTPVCIVTQQSATLTGGAAGCTVSGTTVTITAATLNSETWGALVFGNPN
jgi:hypothetical protein